jgi:Putative beta-barrel porin-2, OmpL-like. bbp2
MTLSSRERETVERVLPARTLRARCWRRFRVIRMIAAIAVVYGFPPTAGAQSVAQQTGNIGFQEQPAVAAAQPTSPFEHVQFGVTFEGYYQYNWNRPYDRVNLLRAYDTRANVFSIQQTAVVIESAPDVDAGRRFGARVDLQFGQATETVQGGAANEPRPDVYRHIWQAYGTYVFPVGRGLQTDFGKFASNLGYETNYAKDNNHFSRAYLFNFLPFYHSGLRLTLPVHDKVTLMYMLTNGIQQTEDFNDFKSNHVTAIVKPITDLTWTINYYFGQEQPDGGEPEGPDGFFRVFDTYFAYTVTPKVSVGLDVNYVTNEANKSDDALSLQGTGVYLRFQASDPAGLSLRYERLDDEGLFGGIDQVLHEVTLTAEYKFADGFLARGEFRRDWSNDQFFTGRRQGDLRKDQNTFLIGLVWWFGNKSGAW